MQLKILKEEDLTDKICVVVGTRPGIIKFSPVIRELEKRKSDFFVIHTGQHYSYKMDKTFFEDLNLPKPKYKLSAVSKCKLHGEQTAAMLRGIEKILIEERPKIVMVEGDANTNLAGALAARKLHINVGHVEAGLRSGDWRMPEEHNRVMIDHISDYLFAPTEKARKNLLYEHVKGKIYVTGNTIVDAVSQNLYIAKRKSRIIDEIKMSPKIYFLLTLHREENIDYVVNFRNILAGLEKITEKNDCEVVFPVHPRTRKRLKEFDLTLPRKVKAIDQVGYLDFLLLLSNGRLVLTDSGGIQEESCILHIPCVTLRENTERPETVEVGANFVAGIDPDGMLEGVNAMLNIKRNWNNPFGENASEKIVTIIEKELELE